MPAKRPGSGRIRPLVPRSKVPEANTRRADGTRICGARTRGGGNCQNTFLQPNGRCRMHGGSTPRGLLSANIVTGRYAADLPARLQERFSQAMNDQDLLSLRKDISLLDAILTAKMAELRDAEMNPDLNAITEQVDIIARDWRGWDWTRMERELTSLRESIAARANEGAILREVRELVREKASVVSQENRRLVELDQNMTVEQGMLLMQSLVGIIRKYVMPLENGQRMMQMIALDFREVITIRET